MESTEKKRILIAAGCFAVFAATVWFLVEAMFFPSVEFGLKRLPAIAFFTIQSNIIAAIWLLYTGLSQIIDSLPRPKPVLGMMLCCYITVTGIVYWAALVPMLGFAKELFAVSNIWMHTVTPVFVVLVFALISKAEKIRPAGVLLMLIYPFLYTVYAYILHRTIGVYLYPFFNPSVMGSGLLSAAALAVIAGLFVGLGFLYRHLWNKGAAEEKAQKPVRHVPEGI